MPAPIQVGASRAQSNTPVFFVAPGEASSAFSRATSGFLATRTPLATAELNRKIALMAPQDMNKGILDLLSAESEHVKNMAAAGKDYRDQMNLALKYATDVESQAIQGQATTRAASVNARGQLRGQELARDVNLRQQQELAPTDAGYRDMLKEQLALAAKEPDVAKRKAAIEELLADAFGGTTAPAAGRFRGDETTDQQVPIGGRLSSASPAAKQSVGRDLMGMFPNDPEIGQMIGRHVGASPINAPEDMMMGDVAGDRGDGRDVTARNLGARDPQVGEAGKFALEQARKMAANEPRGGGAGDAVLSQFGDQLASLRAQNGRSRRVDFNAPLIRDEAYAAPFDAIENAWTTGTGNESGDHLATALKSAAQRGRAHGGMTGADLTGSERLGFRGPVTVPEPPPIGAMFSGGRDSAETERAAAAGRQRAGTGTGRGVPPPKAPAGQGAPNYLGAGLRPVGRGGGMTPEEQARANEIIARVNAMRAGAEGVVRAGAFGAQHANSVQHVPDRAEIRNAAQTESFQNLHGWDQIPVKVDQTRRGRTNPVDLTADPENLGGSGETIPADIALPGSSIAPLNAWARPPAATAGGATMGRRGPPVRDLGGQGATTPADMTMPGSSIAPLQAEVRTGREPGRVYEDDPGWDPATMGNKRGTVGQVPEPPPISEAQVQAMMKDAYGMQPDGVRAPAQAPADTGGAADVYREGTDRLRKSMDAYGRGPGDTGYGQPPEQNQQEYLTTWDDGGVSKPKVAVRDTGYTPKHGTAPYVPPAQQQAAVPAAAPAPAAGGPSLYGAIEGAGQTQQAVPAPPPMTMGADPRVADIIARVKARQAGVR